MSHLNHLEVECSKIILHQAITELSVCQAKYGTKTKEIEKSKKPIESRFIDKKYAENGIFYRKTGEFFDQAADRLKFDKLNGDKIFLINFLNTTLTELKIRNQFEKLKTAVNNEIDVNDGEKQFLIDFFRNKFVLNELKQRQDLYKTRELEKVTRNEELDQININHSVKARHVQNWEHSRQEQQRLLREKMENVFEAQIEKSAEQIAHENSSHEGIQLFLLKNLEQMRRECEIWKENYDRDYAQFELDIHIAEDEFDEFQKYEEEIKALFNKRQNVIDAHLKSKRDKEEAILRAKMSVKLQAWWRGVMVRNKLGPFRVKKRRGGRRSRRRRGRQ